MFSKKSVLACVPASLFIATPVAAQYMPHLDPNTYIFATMNYGTGQNTCLTGSPPPENEIDEARLPAPDVMTDYFNAAQNGGSISRAFRESKKSKWTHGETSVAYDQIDAQEDPLAVTGNSLEREPLRFFRAGDFQTAHGQWLVRDGAGAVTGVYDARFKRRRSEWKLHELTVLGADEKVVPAMQYCIEPGDVADHKVESADTRIEFLTKNIEKSEVKLVKDRQRLADVEAKLAAKPGRSHLKERVKQAAQKVERREEKLAGFRENLEDAREFASDAKRDVTEIAAMTLSAREAMRLRDFELTTDKEAAAEKAAEEAEAAADE